MALCHSAGGGPRFGSGGGFVWNQLRDTPDASGKPSGDTALKGTVPDTKGTANIGCLSSQRATASAPIALTRSATTTRARFWRCRFIAGVRLPRTPYGSPT
jgi:hypothetical protein